MGTEIPAGVLPCFREKKATACEQGVLKNMPVARCPKWIHLIFFQGEVFDLLFIHLFASSSDLLVLFPAGINANLGRHLFTSPQIDCHSNSLEFIPWSI